MDTTTEIKNNMPLVSILMLNYNGARFIGEAISSVVSQTYQNWELIIIDDGSTDDTANVVKGFSDQRICYIKHPQNAGLFVRRAESTSYVTGKYTAVLDSDDLWIDNEKLAKQVDFLETHPEHVVVGTMTKLINDIGKKIGQSIFAIEDEQLREKILIRNQFTHSSLLIKTEALKKTSGYQPTLAEDLELILQLGKIGQMSNLPEIATAHRVHVGSQNDHGLKMATAVQKIVYKHANKYPGATQAKIFSYLRLLRARIKIF